MATGEAEAEILYGVNAIAKFLGLPARGAAHQIEQGRIPVFRLGSKICARPATLRAWAAEQESAGRVR